MNDLSLQNQLKLLNQKYKKMDAIYHAAALKFKVADSVFWILYVISEADTEYTQYSLCNDWFYSKQTINSAIGSLVKLGYIYMAETRGSRNQKIIRLTDEGRKFTSQTIEKIKQAELEALSSMTEIERQEFMRLTDKYLNSFHHAVSQTKYQSSED